MKIKKAAPVLILIALFSASVFFTFNPVKQNYVSHDISSEFYVGVEFAYSNNPKDAQVTLNNLKTLVDKVQDYTNLFVIGLPEISLNQTLLNESCNYISNAGLHFIVLFTNASSYNYSPSEWTTMAKQKYGDKFLGVYRLDEPGGKELENNSTERFLNPNSFSKVEDYAGASQEYVGFLQQHIQYFHQVFYPTLFTSDFGLFWFDYQGGYDTVFTEFVGNQSRQVAISLCRGAATVLNKQWGVIVTWTYDKKPYIESGQKLLSDLTLAYQAGAKYEVVFDYPNSTQYGILGNEHFDALKSFWDYANSNPQTQIANLGKVAYVLPVGYGFGFRGPNDTIWGIWKDDLSSKIWNDTDKLIKQYGTNLDIVYGNPQFMNILRNHYDRLFFWNETIN